MLTSSPAGGGPQGLARSPSSSPGGGEPVLPSEARLRNTSHILPDARAVGEAVSGEPGICPPGVFAGFSPGKGYVIDGGRLNWQPDGPLRCGYGAVT